MKPGDEGKNLNMQKPDQADPLLFSKRCIVSKFLLPEACSTRLRVYAIGLVARIPRLLYIISSRYMWIPAVETVLVAFHAILFFLGFPCQCYACLLCLEVG